VSIEAFSKCAVEFRAWVEGPPGTETEEAACARRHLAALYAAALQLPERPPTSPRDLPPEREGMSRFRRFGSLPINYYGAADPLVVPATELLVGDLADGLSDVWSDVRRGLELYEAGLVPEAGWSWRFDFETHWGAHAANALAALHAWHCRYGRGPLFCPPNC
jgi:hypothetical protein